MTLLDIKHYKIFESSRLVTAKNFLLQPENVITARNQYIHVQTPNGTLCRDMDGIHELN